MSERAKKVGRPRKFSDAQMEKLVKEFESYIEENTIPIVAEFAYQHKIPSCQLYDFPEFSTLLKRAMDKKQTNLEKGALGNKLNVPMSIFSLKQIGWSDRMEQKISVSTDDDTKKRLSEIFKETYDSRGKKNT